MLDPALKSPARMIASSYPLTVLPHAKRGKEGKSKTTNKKNSRLTASLDVDPRYTVAIHGVDGCKTQVISQIGKAGAEWLGYHCIVVLTWGWKPSCLPPPGARRAAEARFAGRVRTKMAGKLRSKKPESDKTRSRIGRERKTRRSDAGATGAWARR